MTTQWNAMTVLESDFNTALENTRIPTNNRELIFENLNKILSRTISFYGSTDTQGENIKDAMGIKKLITGGGKAKKKPKGETLDVKKISTSHLSFLQKTENLERLIMFYENDLTFYNPNETALKTVSLRATLTDIRTANDSIDVLIKTLVIKRTARNYALYNLGNGIIDVALACKKYIRGLYGVRSPEARLAGKIKLKRFLKLQQV